jgi:hypothetical protein
MNLEGARRVMETTSHETANQYLRFGWSLINQYVVEATADTPAMVKYVLASVRRLEDTRRLLTLTDADAVNEHLAVGWRLVDKYVTASPEPVRRDEALHFVLAWQSDEAPTYPGETASSAEPLEADSDSDELY